MDRRGFVRTSAAGLAAAVTPVAAVTGRARVGAEPARVGAEPARVGAEPGTVAAPAVHTRAARPLVISDLSGIRYRNGGSESAVERAFRGITEGEDVLDALIAGVNIPELDPTERGIGYGALPNAAGVVQLDACCMHGPRKWAGGVAAIEGVRTPSLVAKAVAELTDHHLIVGEGAREFARALGFRIEEDLNTPESRALWLEWRRRVDPGHWLDPEKRLDGGAGPGEETDPGAAGRPPFGAPIDLSDVREREAAGLAAGLSMVEDGLIDPGSFWGTINCDGLGLEGEICGVTTTSGLSWKIPGRAGDSPILGAGLYVDDDVGAAGSTGRGEANLYNLCSYLIVERMRDGMSPRDAGMAALRRVRTNTVESRLLNERGLPNFDLRFFILNTSGDYAGVALYGAGETHYAVCTENGAEEVPFEGLLEGAPRG